MRSIRKSAAVILRDGLLLVVRKEGTDVFISPGGKPEPGENHRACLARELREELCAEMVEERAFGVFHGVAVFEDVALDLEVSLVSTAEKLEPAAEIEEIAWIAGDHEAHGIRVASVFARQVIPALIDKGLMRRTLAKPIA